MSRMAEQFGDASLRIQYENDAITLMNEGLDFDTFNSNAINAQTRWSDLTEWNRGSYGIAYPLFYLTPEVARYMSSQINLRNTIDTYIYAEPEIQPSGSGGGGYAVIPLSVTWLWPLWWMAQAPIGDGGYFGEGCAAGSEQRMMLFNYYAWVRNEPSATLRYYLDVPDALIGDLYYIQNLVTTIESYGQTCWEDTITGVSNCEVIDDPSQRDWLMFGRDLKRTSYTPNQVDPPTSGHPVWVRDFFTGGADEAEIISNNFQPLVLGNRVFIGTTKNNMYALDTSDGSIIWKFDADEPGMIIATAAIMGNNMYFGSTNGYFYIINVNNGNLITKNKVVKVGGFRSSSAPTATAVYIGGEDGYLYALDPYTGQIIWEYDSGVPILSSPAVDLENSRIYFSNENMYGFALNLNGDFLWRTNKFYGTSTRNYYPVIIDDKVVFRTSPGRARKALNGGDSALARAAGITHDSSSNPIGDFFHVQEWNPPIGFDASADPGAGDLDNEYNGIMTFLNNYPEYKTFYVVNSNTGIEEIEMPILWTQGSGEVGEPPIVDPNGNAYLKVRSYYSDFDAGGIVYYFTALAELDFDQGRINLLEYDGTNNGFSTGLFLISDESAAPVIGGERLYYYNHGDSVGSYLPSTRTADKIGGARDYPHEICSGTNPCRDSYVPFGQDALLPRLIGSGGGAEAQVGLGMSIGDNKVFYVSQSMLGMYETDFSGSTNYITNNPAETQPVTNSVNVPDTSQLESYVLDVEPLPISVPVELSEVVSKLESEISDYISGLHYEPFLYANGKGMSQEVFVDPTEDAYVLGLAYPFVSQSLKTGIVNFMNNHLQTYSNPLNDYLSTGTLTGRRRERYYIDNDVGSDILPERTYPGGRYEPGTRVYNLWVYAYNTGDWNFVNAYWNSINNHCNNINSDSSDNKDFANLVGCTRIAQQLGHSTEMNQYLNAATSVLRNRLQWEQNNRIDPDVSENWSSLWIQESNPLAFMENGWSYGCNIPRYESLTPELGRALRDFASSVVSLQNDFIDTTTPAQHLPYGWIPGRGETFSANPSQTREVFTAKAFIMDSNYSDLETLISIPWSKGDLWFMERLALTLASQDVLTPICNDNDGDTYSVEGGSCGSVDCNDNNNAVYPGATETCNNIDDNCANGIDDNLQRTCSLNYQGICAVGTESCSAGTWSGCPSPQAEICENGIDEDCNGIDQPCQIEITNILQNGDFELGTAQYWETITDSQITSTVVHGGNYAVQITDNSASQGWITVTPGQTYVFSGWLRWDQFSNNEWGYDRFRVMNTNWEDIAVLNNMHIRYEQGQWHKLALTFTPDTDGVRINFGLYGPETTVEMYFDDLMLFEKIGNIPPTINPTSDITSGNVPLTVQFYTNGDDVDGAIEYYNWDFGDGTVSRLKNPTNTFYKRGNYNVNLTVWDNDGTTVSQTINILVNDNTAPTISITSPSSSEYYNTGQSTLMLSGNAQSSNENIIDIVWDNINTDEAGILSINPSTSLFWTTPQISLKPGKNEILVTATDSQDRIDTDKIIIYRQISGPSISNIQVNSNNVRVYEKYEISFDLETVAENYFFNYDINPPSGVIPGEGITVEGIFRTPTGKILTQQGFYYKEAINQNGVYEETGTENWVIRLSPQEIGQYDVSLRVQDASGSVTVPVGTFSALTPVKQGFIKVSEDDSRYFEFSNGDLFWPLGHVIETDYSLNKGTGLNLERPWMGGRGAYSTNWAKWISSAEQHGNEGYMSRLNYEYHYPSHELSREIFYPNGYRIRIPCWQDENFCHNLNPNTDYQIKLRLKTVDISGPVDPSSPYGFVVKQSNWWSSADPIPSDVLNRESIITPVNVNRDWHTIVSTYTTSSSTYSEFNLYLENVNSGEVYIDQFSVREILLDGTLGPEQIRQSKGDMHTYVEQRPAAYFDWQVEQGEDNDVFFKYVVHDKNDWIQNHLLDIGIFHDAGHGYYQNEDTKARWLVRQWYRYLIARWGYSTAIHSWELNNEGSPNAESHWRTTQYFAEFMHDNDAHPHLATTSFWSEWVPQFWGDNTNYPDVDYADLHQYSHDNFEYTTDAAFFHSDVSRIVSESAVSKPVIRGETGLSEPGDTLFNYLSQPNPGIWFHNLIWAQLNSGGMSDPNYWWSQHRNQIDSTAISTPFYLFIQDLDINKGGYVDLNVQLNNPDLRVYGQKNLNKNKAHMWIQNMYHTWRNVMGVENPQTISQESGTITIQMTPNTNYNVMWWDTYNGIEQNTQLLISDSSGNLVLTITNLYDDVAVKITPTTDTSPPSRSNGQPTGVLASGTIQTAISLNTDESATCRYSTSSGVSYNSMSNTFSTSNNIYHSRPVTGLQDGQSYSYYIKCMDQNNNANTNDFIISFSIAQQIVCTDNDGDTYAVEGGSCGNVDCNDNNNAINPGATELCNNIDDNCANGVDENLQRDCSLNYQGICAIGTESCSAGLWSGCPTAQIEICGNGIDENCNGNDLLCPTAPRIFDVRPVYISPTETRILWRTDISSTSQVEYGTIGENDLTHQQIYEYGTTEDASLVTDHVVVIDNLQPETRYNFRVISRTNSQTTYSKDLLFATLEESGRLHQSHEQLDTVLVDGSNIRIRKRFVPYIYDMTNISINNFTWIDANDLRIVTPEQNHTVNILANQDYEVNLSQDVYLHFNTPPPTKSIVLQTQNESSYRRIMRITSPNHFYDVEARELVNLTYSNWILWHINGNVRTDVTTLYNFRLFSDTAIFDGFNTSNITFEIEGNNECMENWDCSDWSSCSDNQQSRSCTDLNNCGTENNKPSEQQSCISEEDSGSSSSGGGGISFFMPCNHDWLCGVWNPSICPSTGVQTRDCIDQNNCEIPLIETQQCTYITLEGEIIETYPGSEHPKEFCGNNKIDEDENSETCCKDVGCPAGYTCTVLNSCVKNSKAKLVKNTLQIVVLVILLSGLILFIVSKLTITYKHDKQVKSRADYRQYLTILKDFMLRAENKGKSEHELEEELKKIGWDKTYIKDAEKEIKKERKFIGKSKKKKT